MPYSSVKVLFMSTKTRSETQVERKFRALGNLVITMEKYQNTSSKYAGFEIFGLGF